MPSCYPGLALEHKVAYHMLPPSYGWMPTPSAALWMYACMVVRNTGVFFQFNSIHHDDTSHTPSARFSFLFLRQRSSTRPPLPALSPRLHSAARHSQEGRKAFRGSCRCLWPGRLSRRCRRRGSHDSKIPAEDCFAVLCNGNVRFRRSGRCI